MADPIVAYLARRLGVDESAVIVEEGPRIAPEYRTYTATQDWPHGPKVSVDLLTGRLTLEWGLLRLEVDFVCDPTEIVERSLAAFAAFNAWRPAKAGHTPGDRNHA